MTSVVPANFPLFVSLTCSFIAGVVASVNFPSQKYVLQKRNSQGHFVRMATYTEPVSPEKVTEEFGNGYFILRSCKPRFQTEWKAQLGVKEDQPKETPQNSQLERLEKRTRLLTIGVVTTGAVEALSLGLIHMRFSKVEDEIAQLRAVNQTLSAQGLQCPGCGSQVEYMMQHVCHSCGGVLTWPKSHLLPPPNPDGQCLGCNGYLQAHEKFCPSCGQPRTDGTYSVLVFSGGG